MKVFDNIVGLLCFSTGMLFLFRLYMLIIDLVLLHKGWIAISNDVTFLIACSTLVVFFFRSTLFDVYESKKQGYNALLNMKNASFLAFIACVAKFVTALMKFFYQDSVNAITVTYVIFEFLLWLALSVYFFVYWKNKNMELNLTWIESIQFKSLKKILPGDSISRKLQKWEQSEIIAGCNDIIVKRVLRKNDIYIDLYWYVKRQGEDNSKMETFFARCSKEAVEENIYKKEKQIVEFYTKNATA